jgi:ABC-2 type transport system ATP-binding protein
MNPVLALENVHKSLGGGILPFRKPILKGLSFQVDEGEVVGFLGPNGSGKTTTIKCILNLLRLDRGSIRIFGEPHHRVHSHRRLGFLPENPYFYDYLTGLEFLVFYASLCGVPPAEGRRRGLELLEKVGLSHAAGLPLRKYSRGMLQRVGLAQALAGNPDLVILDEPMSGLDPFGRHDVRDLILELKRGGKTIFFSSHVLADVELLCDRVVVLKDGQALMVDVSHLLNKAGTEGYEIVCRNLPAPLVKTLNAEKGSDGSFLLRAGNLAERERFVHALGEAKAVIESLTPQKPSLEKVVLEMFERKPMESAGGPR